MNLIECWIEHPVLQLDKTYSYVTENDSIVPGVRVLINFNHREIIGFVESVTKYNSLEEINEEKGFECKPILSVLDEESYLTPELINLAKWMAYDTVSPTISCFKTMLPSKVKPTSSNHKIKMEKWVHANDFEASLTPKQAEVYEYVCTKGELKYTDLRVKYGVHAKNCIDKGVLEVIEKEVSAIFDDEIVTSERLNLSECQEKAMKQIQETDKSVILLHGLTGSGKTEVYLQLAEEVVEKGKQVLFLVPEISLTPQMVSRVKSRFGSHVAIYHSGLNPQEKYEQFKLVKEGVVNVVVGTRSSVFMPFYDLGLIILDEEHDHSYKQDNTPQYHCRDIAIHRASTFGCKVILGSATPSLESYARAIRNVYELVEMNQRINETLPTIHCVNLKNTIKKGESYILSNTLIEKIEERLKRHEQVILLLNRRGYSTTLRCNRCQEVIMCPHCELAMSYHASDKTLKCHTCGEVIRNIHECPTCKSKAGFSTFGFGTQRLEEELQQRFKESRILRMDADTTSKKNSHERLLQMFEDGKADILVGTQMIAKGLDYPRVTLVGVLNADAGLNRSDYRSVESTFDLIVQASGRSGRSELAGEVVLQVFDEEHYAIQTALRQDYVSFFNCEMKFRHAGGYPPYNYMISILVQDMNQDKAKKIVKEIHNELKGDFKILGPSTLLRIKDTYRYRILIKGKDLEKMKDCVRSVVREKCAIGGCPTIKVDVNPMILD
ncbi:MAG: primosomal protein N' [Anaerorhabdus sp.]|uniref:replication restart helicase PriA n=1 Tax=Anaerorhabdus sp. TaxID=1872524 RepID=UPI002FCA1F58